VRETWLGYYVAEVWRGAEFPERCLPRRAWLTLFREGGYFSDSLSGPPTEPVRLYRGAIPRYARGMAWTRDPSRARWFADRWSLTADRAAFVYAVDAPPDAILAEIDLRREREMVVDPSRLGRIRRF
jgi:hypothetical protein